MMGDIWKICVVVMVVLVMEILCGVHTVTKRGAGSLYQERFDPVVILNASNFDAAVLNKSNAWLIEFYSTWCGFCIQFAPTFKEFAFSVNHWQRVVRIGVIDSADIHNQPIFQRYNVTTVPHLKWFSPFTRDASVMPIQVEKFASVEDGRKAVINLLQNEQKPYPSQWIFSTLDINAGSSLDELWSSNQHKEMQRLFVIVEPSESFVGREIILDLTSSGDSAVRVSSENDKLVNELITKSSEFGVDKSIMLFEITVTHEVTLLASGGDNETALAIFHKALEQRGFFEPPTTLSPELRPTLPPIVADYSKVYLIDYENCIARTILQEIAGHVELNKTAAVIASKFLDAVVKFVPIREKTAENLAMVVRFLRSKNGTTSQEFKEFLSFYPDLITEKDYEGCRGSQPGLRGYPCSLWMTMHALSVGAYQRHYSNRLSLVEPEKVLFIIRDYIVNFFSCEWCRRHFYEMAKSLEKEAKKPEDAILWLWDAHNRVNKRLAKGKTEDPQRPKVQFPPKSLCDKCYDSTSTDENIIWNRTEVLLFLRNFYGRSNIISRNYDASATAITLYPSTTLISLLVSIVVVVLRI